MPVLDHCEDMLAPKHREETEIETMVEKLEGDLKEVNQTTSDLRHTYCELMEMRYVLKKTQQFFDEVSRTVPLISLIS